MSHKAAINVMTPPKPTILLLKEKSKGDQDPYEAQLTQHGFNCVFVPVLEHCIINLDELRTIMTERSSSYTGLVVTSKRAVDALGQVWGALEDRHKRVWVHNPVFTVGPSTANLVRNLGLTPSGEAAGCAHNLGQEIIRHFNNGHNRPSPRLLFLVGDKRRDELPNMMKQESIIMDELLVYETQLRKDLEDTIRNTASKTQFDWVALFSPSGSKALDMLTSKLANSTQPPRIAAIGETTRKHLKDRGYGVDAVADKPDANSLSIAVIQKHG